MPETPQSPQSKSLIHEEEARTELLATLAAARELGPDMDGTLAGRYVERISTLFPDPARDQDRLRRDVEALLTSARGHSADADDARVRDFLRSTLAPQPASPAIIQRPAPPAPTSQLADYLPMLIGAAVIIAIVAASGGQAYWLLFWLLPMLFWSSRGRRRRMRYRRYGYWDGGYGPSMPPRGSRRQLPPDDDEII
ncbi:MAG TPA: hypothetical protein VFQ25_05150 [Ktedonobacterales bacterium]|nr:hypothetical protein [Ktedonobacterales bacterium]